MRILNDWKDFFAFLREPDYLDNGESIFSKSLLTFNSFLLNVILIIPLLIIYGVYLYISDNVPKTNIENVLNLYHPVILYAMVAIYEEFSFRGFLKKFNPVLFSISITGIIAIYFKKIVFKNMMFEPEGLMETGVLIVILFSILFLIARKYNNAFKQFWDRNFKYIVYSSAFLFAFIHFFNSTDWDLSYLKTNIFQLIAAFIFSFVRIRAGLVFAIILHFIWNIML